jgi:hypothetical protein
MILRPHFDPTRQPPTGPTSFPTERNTHEVRCGMCAKPVYVDEETYRFVSEAVEAGLNSPFRCEVCAEEYDDLAYEG